MCDKCSITLNYDISVTLIAKIPLVVLKIQNLLSHSVYKIGQYSIYHFGSNFPALSL